MKTLEQILFIEIEASNIVETVAYKLAREKNNKEEVEKNLSKTYMAGLGIGLLCLPFGAIAAPIALAAVFTGAFYADVSEKVRDVDPIENLKINVKTYLDNRFSL